MSMNPTIIIPAVLMFMNPTIILFIIFMSHVYDGWTITPSVFVLKKLLFSLDDWSHT